MKVARLYPGDPERELDALIVTLQGIVIPAATIVVQALAVGGAAGAHALDGIEVGDEIIAVIDLTTETELTSEFSVLAPNQITNAGGTDTTGQTLLVTWVDRTGH